MALLIVARAAQGQDAEPPGDPCGFATFPSADEPDGWGLIWSEDAAGQRLPDVRIVPMGASSTALTVTIFLGDGATIGWSEGPYAFDTPTVSLALEGLVGTTLAYVSIAATATDPTTGTGLAHAGLSTFAWRDRAGRLWLGDETSAGAVAVPRVGSSEDPSTVEEPSLIGREVVP